MGDCPLEPEQDYVGKTGQPPPSHLKRPQNIWPSEAPWWREGLYQYYNHVLPLAMKLVKLFALGLGLQEDELDQYFKFPITGMRPLYYPPTPVDNDNKDVTNVGLGAHSDFDCESARYNCFESYLEITDFVFRAHARASRQRSSTRGAQPVWTVGVSSAYSRDTRLQCWPVLGATDQRAVPRHSAPSTKLDWARALFSTFLPHHGR